MSLVDLLSKNKNAKFEIQKTGDRSEIKNDFAQDLMMGFASANIPAHKLKNKILQKIFIKVFEKRSC